MDKVNYREQPCGQLAITETPMQNQQQNHRSLTEINSHYSIEGGSGQYWEFAAAGDFSYP